ncbi:MAG: 4-hydroxy-tetrahydrodipicolinate synthase [Alphaproteobacteria bacterium]|nr:4-hydroxy-tetrahydrodipicolinate synthase [Alphaproteobacteria bacterium]
MMLSGTLTALITPFKNGNVDFEALERFVEWQIASGINGLVPCASTGEFATLSKDEQKEILKTVVRVNNGRVPVVAGASDINPYNVIDLGRQAMECGVDAVMVVAPYYVKPTQDQIHDFYTLIDDSLKCPLLLYNNPGRCAISMSIETIVKLSSRKTIIGIKEADADITRPTKFLNSINRTDFAILSGNSSSTPAFLAEGGHGTISVTSNVDPVRCVQNVNAWFDQDLKTFARLRQELIDLDEALYLEPAPATIKYALSVRGICSDEVRPPLGRFTDKHKPEINQLLSSMNLGKV